MVKVAFYYISIIVGLELSVMVFSTIFILHIKKILNYKKILVFERSVGAP